MAYDVAVALALAGSDVYVTGWSGGAGTETDYATVKHNGLGNQEWVTRYSSPGDSFDEATALAVDGSGNVYVAGTSSRVGARVWTTIKYIQA